MKFNKEIQQRDSTKRFKENFNFITNIIILLILVFGGIGYSVGFHFPNEILPGQFADGNYSFNGSLGIGTSSPLYNLHINSSLEPRIKFEDNGTFQAHIGLSGGNGGIIQNSIRGDLVIAANLGRSILFGELSDDSSGGNNTNVIIAANGNVGIGTSTPTSKLEIVNANTGSNFEGLHITNNDPDSYGLAISGPATGAISISGTNPQCVDNHPNSASGACSLNDYAEMMEFSEEPEDGDLIIIDTVNPGLLKVSTKPYDNLVAGIASKDPAMVIGSYDITIKGWTKNNATEDGYWIYPLAIAGRKLIKVTDENGEVMPGDLLVSSSERGKAMRCDKSVYIEKCVGAIIGKAITSAGENELVLALVTSQ